jgi:hypothetical protein
MFGQVAGVWSKNITLFGRLSPNPLAKSIFNNHNHNSITDMFTHGVRSIRASLSRQW